MIHFFEKGEGNPIVLIHGFCETSQMWGSFAETLSKEFRVICPDLPGFGNSPIDSDQISLEQVASKLETWLLEEEIQNPIVIGHSLGGYVALALLERMGDKIKAIGLFHSTSFADDLEKKEMRDRTVTFLQKHGVDKFVTTFVPQLFPESRKIELQAEINEAISQAKKSTLNGLIAFSRAMRDRKDRSELVRKFKGSKLFIAGTLDGAVKIEASRAQQEMFTTYHELAETGHMGMIERKEETLALVRQFCLFEAK
jgi:pimeloyl-ACP methyl ester carboxylesterase